MRRPRVPASIPTLALLSLSLLWAAPARPESDAWFAAGREALAKAQQLPRLSRARNVILFLGDGMGVGTVTAARILEGQQRGQSGEENSLAFERLPYLALAKTYNTDQQVPDSAGTMTALVTGAKTRAGTLSVDEEVPRGSYERVAGHRLPTLLEQAEQRGLSTGIVSTATITHATPAACYAHAPERRWEDDSQLSPEARAADFPDIARQLIEFSHGDGLEVALGGGRAHFLPENVADPEEPAQTGQRRDGRDLTAEWVRGRPKARYVWNREQFEDVDPSATQHLLGLFEPSHMEYEADRGGDRAGEPSLSEMTAKAIAMLARNPRGFFLMVEAGRIDHAHHQTNAFRALVDTIEFSNAVRTALELTDPRETLVIVTADHDHTLTMGGYPVRGNDILGVVVAHGRGGEGPTPMRDGAGRAFTTLGYFNGPGHLGATSDQAAGPKRMPHRPQKMEGRVGGRPELTTRQTSDPDYLQETAVPLSSETHDGRDVPVYAGGPGSHLVHGVQEQNYFYHVMAEALGWTPQPETAPIHP